MYVKTKRAQVSIDYVHGPLADTITRFSGNHSQVDNFKVRTSEIDTFSSGS